MKNRKAKFIVLTKIMDLYMALCFSSGDPRWALQQIFFFFFWCLLMPNTFIKSALWNVKPHWPIETFFFYAVIFPFELSPFSSIVSRFLNHGINAPNYCGFLCVTTDAPLFSSGKQIISFWRKTNCYWCREMGLILWYTGQNRQCQSA